MRTIANTTSVMNELRQRQSSLTLSGAKASGKALVARVGTHGAGDLTIASPIDESHYVARESSAGFNLSVPIPSMSTGAPSLGLNASQLNLLAQYEAVRQQSALSAGVDGFDVTVNGHTHLKGGALTTEGAVASSRLVTQTLTHEGVNNRDVVEGRGWSIGLNVGNLGQNGWSLGASSAGYARLDTNEHSHTAASVGGVLTLTRPDLQDSRVAAMKGAERSPLVYRLGQVSEQLSNLYYNEPPQCADCYIPRGEGTADTPSAQAAAPSPTAGANPARPLTPEIQANMGSSPEWQAWWEAVQALQAESAQLHQRIAVIDAKVYGTAANLRNDPSSLHQPLLHTFDGTKATQELRDGVAVTAAFGKAAYKTAGTEAGTFEKAAARQCALGVSSACEDERRWGEGGLYRTALHMAVGGMSFGTAGATSNLVSSGLMTNAINRAIEQLQITDAGVIQGLRAAAALIAGTASGGTSGAVAAFNADANNRQLHPREIEIIKREAGRFARQLNGGAEPTAAEIDAAEARLAQEAFRTVQFGAPGATDATAKQFLAQFRENLTDPRFPLLNTGFTFYATPEQKADPFMYADLHVSSPAIATFYAKNALRAPSPAEASAAIGRYVAAEQKARMWTWIATALSGGAALAAPAASAAGPALTWCLANVVSCGTLVADMAAGQAVGPSGVGGLLGIGGIKAIKTAQQANIEWIAIRPGNAAAWTEGTKVVEAQIPAGQRLVMYVDETQRTKILSNQLSDGLGGWATFDSRWLNEAQVREAFAVTQGFKTGPLYRVELELTQPTLGRVGFTGPQQPQSLHPGGGHQFQFVDYQNRAGSVRIITPPTPVPPGG